MKHYAGLDIVGLEAAQLHHGRTGSICRKARRCPATPDASLERIQTLRMATSGQGDDRTPASAAVAWHVRQPKLFSQDRLDLEDVRAFQGI